MNCNPEISASIAKPAKNKPTIQVKQIGSSSVKPSGRKNSPQTPTVAQLQSQTQKQILSQSQVIQIKPPQTQNLPALNSPHVQQHVPSPPQQTQGKPQNNDERITNLLGRILQIEKNDHQRRAMLLKSVKLFLSQKNPALTQPMISLFLLVFKSVFSTAPPFSVITKSYRHIYFNPRDHPEDVSICYQLFEIINSLQPSYPKELLHCLVRRLSSASVDDRNGAKKCLLLVDDQYSSFLLHNLCLEMIPPPPHGIDTLLELTVELLKLYKSSNTESDKNPPNNTLQSISATKPTIPTIKTKSNSSNATDSDLNKPIQKLSSNPNLDSNKISNLKLGMSSNSFTNLPIASISIPNPNTKNSVNSNQNNNQKLNSTSKLSINSNSHSNLPVIPISIPNPHAKSDTKPNVNTNIKTNTKKNSNAKQNVNANSDSNTKASQNTNLKTNLNTNSKNNSNIRPNSVANTNSKPSSETGKSVKLIVNTKANPNPITSPNSENQNPNPPKSNPSISTKPNPVTAPKPKASVDTDAIFTNLKHRLEISADDSLFSELQRTFRLLHFAPHFQTFFHPLLAATKALISKNENFAHESRRFLLNYWPRLDPQKAVLFLQEATALCKEGPEIEEFVWQRLSWRASSIQWQIAMEGLNFITQTFQRAEKFDHSVLLYLLKDATQHHWNSNVKNKVNDVIKLVESGDARAPKIFPMNTWNLIKSTAEMNYPNVDFNGRRRRK